MKKIISISLIVVILFSATVPSFAYSYDESKLDNLMGRENIRREIEKLSSIELDAEMDKYYEVNDELFMQLSKEKARREGKFLDLNKYEKEIRSARTPEELQVVIDKYDEYFIFEKDRSLTDDEFNLFVKANPEILAHNLTADDLYVKEQLVWHREELVQDKKEGIFNRILNDLLGIGVGYYSSIASIVYSLAGYFSDDGHYYRSNMHVSTVADESLTKRTVLVKGTDYPSYGYAERKRRYDTVKLTIWDGSGRVAFSDSQYVGLVRDQYHDMFIYERDFREEAAKRHNNGAWAPTYYYNSGGANDYKYDKRHYFD